MLFGDELFLATVHQPDSGYEQIYQAIDQIIRPYVLRRTGCETQLQEDLIQDIHLTVWQNLPSFTVQAKNYTPRQRLSWLYTIASNKLTDQSRRFGKPEHALLPLPESITAPNADPEELLIRLFHIQQARDQIDTLLYDVCSLRSRPDGKFAFLYNRVIMPLERGHPRKGDIKAVYTQLHDRTLWDIRCKLEEDLTRVLDRPVPQAVFRALEQSMAGQEHHRFLLSPRQISTASYHIVQSLCAPDAQSAPFRSPPISKEIPFFSDGWASPFLGKPATAPLFPTVVFAIIAA